MDAFEFGASDWVKCRMIPLCAGTIFEMVRTFCFMEFGVMSRKTESSRAQKALQFSACC